MEELFVATAPNDTTSHVSGKMKAWIYPWQEAHACDSDTLCKHSWTDKLQTFFGWDVCF